MIRPGIKQVLLWLTLFSIAMAFVESAVVIYLRELYYPHGFSFPLVTMPGRIALTEILREIATLVMLLAAGYLAGRQAGHWFAWFILCFAIWDIFYYVFLKILLNWPDSWFTWDILFLIPVVWTGPVMAPILVSLTMMLLSAIILDLYDRHGTIVYGGPVLLSLIAGSVLVFLSFVWDYSGFMIGHYSPNALFHADIASLALRQYIPKNFSWWIYWPGEVIILAGIALLLVKNRKKRST